ncbi:YdeI/OmpD-associated family protein [Chitinophaga caseinilytica]|uniref:YdeI/OmpD-associated family protein n=1 Tax=Chitinophaga caseinilytica TaxID=2267521 RepID=A0ABZ2ZC86_9BACT
MPPIPLVDNIYRLEKFAGKGGWTYAFIPEAHPDPGVAFGWVRVRGTIDGHDLGLTRLMPMGQGRLFLPVKTAIQKKIGKKAGDEVRITLYRDTLPVMVPEALQACLDDEPAALEAFRALPEERQKTIVTFVNAAESTGLQTKRILETIDLLIYPKKKP